MAYRVIHSLRPVTRRLYTLMLDNIYFHDCATVQRTLRGHDNYLVLSLEDRCHEMPEILSKQSKVLPSHHILSLSL